MIIKNVNVITCNEKNEVLENAAIVVNGTKIEKIIIDGDLPEDKNVIDGKGKVALPGFINTHTHSAMTFLRNYGSDMNLQDWLFKKIFPAEDRLTEEACYWFNKLAYVEYIKSGITTNADNYFFMDSAARAVSEAGTRALLARSVSGISDGDGKKLRESVEFMKRYDGEAEGRIMTSMSLHAIYTSDEVYMKRFIDAVRSENAGIQIHLSETKKELEDCVQQYGVTPGEYFERAGLFDGDGIKLAAHCVYLTDDEKNMLAEKNVAAAVNMSSNLKLASGIADVPEMIKSGMTVSLGTDGASSNNNLNMFNEMRLVSLVFKGILLDPTAMDAMTTIKLATQGGAKAIGRNDIGIIAEGKAADIILVDFDSSSIVPGNDIPAALVYSAAASDVDTVICNGRTIMQNKIILTLDEEEIKENVRLFAKKILL